jgi:hypothetical protein
MLARAIEIVERRQAEAPTVASPPIAPGDDARALGCLQHVAGLARQVGSASLRPLRDLSIDRRNLHPVPGADEKRSGLSRSRVESLGVFAVSVEDMSMSSPTWRALGQVVLVYFAVGGAAVTAQDTQPGRATFAEMIAFARLASVPCQRLAPDADSFRALALRRLIQPPITEEEIAAKEKDIKRLRVRLGLSRWCKRYAGQMEQARILVRVLRRQN